MWVGRENFCQTILNLDWQLGILVDCNIFLYFVLNQFLTWFDICMTGIAGAHAPVARTADSLPDRKRGGGRGWERSSCAVAGPGSTLPSPGGAAQHNQSRAQRGQVGAVRKHINIFLSVAVYIKLITIGHDTIEVTKIN